MEKKKIETRYLVFMGENGLKEEDWTDRSNWRKKEGNAKWAQEDVETLYSLLNKYLVFTSIAPHTNLH
jgi:hypothetical protein